MERRNIGRSERDDGIRLLREKMRIRSQDLHFTPYFSPHFEKNAGEEAYRGSCIDTF